VAVCSSLRLLKPKRTIESRAKRSSINLDRTHPILLSFTHCGNKSILRVLRIIPVILPEHPSETIAVYNEDGNPARANFKQALDDSDEFRPTPNGTPYWVPDVPEDEKPKKGFFFDNYNDAFEMYQLYSEKARFNIRKAGFKRKNGQITHSYIECNRARMPRRAKEVNTLNEDDGEDGKNPGTKKRKRMTKSQAINCPAKLCLKKIIGTESYMVLDFVENHNHPLMNLNNMDLSKARRQLHFDDYIFIHRASLSNLGPTRAHRLKVALVGGYDKVRGTSTDYCNFKRSVNSFIGDRDAQMLVDKMFNRKKHVLEFSFEYHTLPSKELVRLFWADETMKCNYVAFGDVVSFDATFHTNKYGYKFVPFTGVDNHQKCVTFGAALLSDETTETFCWMLEAFLKTHKKQPPFAVTDQDGALRNAVVKMFPDSHHRLCMWHITEKLPGKVLGDLAADTKFRKDFHKLVWNVYIGPEVFKQRWDDMITRYNLHDNKWLSDMYAIRERYIHMKIRNHSEGSVETCIIRHRDKRSNTVIDATVVLNQMDRSVTCSCGHYNRHGFLCRHVFCVFHIYGIDKIPDAYLNSRWTKNVLPSHLLDKRHRYGPCIEETETLASQIHQTIEDCIGLFRNDSDKLSELLATVKEMKKKLEDETQTTNVEQNKEALYADLLGVTVPDKVVIKTPRSIFRSKGTRRMKSAAEIGKAKTGENEIREKKAHTGGTVIRQERTNVLSKGRVGSCYICCDGGSRQSICKRFPNQVNESDNEEELDEEDEVDNEDEVLMMKMNSMKNMKATERKDSNLDFPHLHDSDKLSELLATVKEMKKKLEDETQTTNVEQNKEALYADLLGVTVLDKVVIKTPRSIFRSKGTRRMKSAAEIALVVEKGHNQATCKGCSACGEAGHHKGVCKRFLNQVNESDNKEELDEEDEVDNEVVHCLLFVLHYIILLFHKK
ncbi:FAR1-related sequence 5-like protein, partial [Tanacetum coccineum]